MRNSLPPKQSHYDIAVVGNSLAARLTAALAAKKGCRVLTVTTENEHPAPWFTSSLLLERILDFLDGNSCRSSSLPFQIITEKQRIDLHPRKPLADELRRELPNSNHEVEKFLAQLFSLGEQIEDMLWDAGGLPVSSFAGLQKFRFRSFRGDVPFRVFKQTLKENLAGFADEAGRKLLGTLFGGFSLTPPDRLTVAECALIWSGLGRKTGVFPSGLDELLRHRAKQFHNTESDFVELKRIRISKAGKTQLLFAGDRIVTADHLVIADRDAAVLCEQQSAPSNDYPRQTLLTAPLGNKISNLLLQHVIIAGTAPLRLTIEPCPAGLRGRIETTPTDKDNLVVVKNVEQKLAPLLPFIDLCPTLQEQPKTGVSIRTDNTSSLLNASNRILPGPGRQYFYAGSDIIPGIGTNGEVLVAVTLCDHLLRACKRPEL